MTGAPGLKASVLVNLFIVAILSAGWIILLCLPYGWHMKMNPMYTMDIGLYKAHVSRGPVAALANWAAHQVSEGWAKVVKDMVTGTYSLSQLQQFFCGITGISMLSSQLGDICLLFNLLTISSMVMILFVSIALITFGLGAYFQYMYWTEKPHDYMRQYQRYCYIAAPSILLLAMVQYTYCSSFLNQFPPAGSSSFSYAYGCAATLTILSVLPVFVSEQMVGRALGEKIQEQLTIQKKFVRDQQAQQEISGLTAACEADMYAAQNQLYAQDYGSMQGGPMTDPSYSQYPPQYGQQYPPQYGQASWPSSQYDQSAWQAGSVPQQP